MPRLIRISFMGFLFFGIVSCNNKAGNKLSRLDFRLIKGFISDTNVYEYAYFKMRVFNNNVQPVRLYLEKWQIPFITQNIPGQKKTGSIFMLDPNRNKLNELLLLSVYPNALTIKANQSIEFFLRASIFQLANHEGETKDPGFQRVLSDRIKSRLYTYYSLNNNGIIEDSVAISVDSNFIITYRAPEVTD